ncbi:MAG TPA: EamA family transporter RarD [Allosphingosinicella sp.]|nr:EamA family transporter RarD [Allosphingosinicella sp.]
MADDRSRTRAGLALGVGAYLLWGVLPLYFKALAAVSPIEIVAHRIVWSLIFLGVLATLSRRWSAIRSAVATPRVLMTLTVTAALIGINWLTFIYAVVSRHMLEGSLGYYLNPLVNVLLGVVLLKERLTRGQILATVLAAAGVSVLAAGAGSSLWISLTLAVTFAFYGFLRKVAPVDSLEGLSIETALLAPVAAGWLLWMQQSGSIAFLHMGLATDLLLVLGGAVTAIPLLLFTGAARRLRYSTLGFLQYIAPSLQFLLAVLAFGEPLTTPHIICFAAIWSALAIFTAESWRASARDRKAADAA